MNVVLCDIDFVTFTLEYARKLPAQKQLTSSECGLHPQSPSARTPKAFGKNIQKTPPMEGTGNHTKKSKHHVRNSYGQIEPQQRDCDRTVCGMQESVGHAKAERAKESVPPNYRSRENKQTQNCLSTMMQPTLKSRHAELRDSKGQNTGLTKTKSQMLTSVPETSKAVKRESAWKQ